MPPNRNTTHPPGSFRELWAVALPLILSSGSLSLMYVVDRVFLTWYSPYALAAVLPAGLLHWTIISILIGTINYTNTFVAQYEGANRKDRVSASVWQGIYLSLGAGSLLYFVTFLAEPIFALAGHESHVQKLEIDYFSILIRGGIPIAISATLACFYSGRGKTVVVMCVNFISTAVNIGLDYCLIFGWGPFPEWGIQGAAVATVTAKIVEVLLYAALMLYSRNSNGYEFLTHRRFDRELFARMLRYGLPTGFLYLVDIAGFTVFIFLIGKIGTREMAATNLSFNLNAMAFIPVMGIGIAVMTLVGKRVGEGRPELAVRTTWLAFALGGGWMLSFAAIYLIFPDVIIAPYAIGSTPEEFAPIRDYVVMLLRFVALYSFFDAMAVIFSNAIRGAGDTRFPVVFAFLTGWSLMVLPTYLCWKYYGGNLWFSWSAVTTYITVIGIGFLIRFQLGHWKTMRVIESHLIGNTEPDRETEKLQKEVEAEIGVAENILRPNFLDQEVSPAPAEDA